VAEASSYGIVYVTSLYGNAADNFMQYDRIYKINGVEITSILEYNIAMSQITAGDSVVVEVYRGTISQSYWNPGVINFSSESTTFTTVAKQYGA